LDFFVNNDSEYNEQVDIVLAHLGEEGFFWDEAKDFIKAPGFRSLKVKWDKSDIFLKLDFVNDSAPHFGDFITTSIFNRIDPIRNILSNKLGAVFRFAGKDVADIREIALHEIVNWQEMINEARQKDKGLELPYIAEVLKTIPQSEFEGVHWIINPGWETFKKDIDKIVFNMLSGA
jgi:hypothetical protein